MQSGGVKEIRNDGFRIRKLLPIECFLLQGFDDTDYHKAVTAYEKKWKPGKSDAQMYIRAGNSITVNVIEEILENLLYQRKQHDQISFI
jgi:DNA (cytosine-5)-methyltransferase 1